MAGAEDYTYGTQTGPASWEGMCPTGQQQSPVNVPVAEVLAAFEQPTEPLHFDYQNLVNATVLNSRHGAQVSFAGRACSTALPSSFRCSTPSC